MLGTKKKDIFSVCPDIQCALQLPQFQLYQNKLSIRLAVSWRKIKLRSLIEMLKSDHFTENNMSLPVALGYDVLGDMFFIDLSELPHLLVGGSTNSGKSVALMCLITSLITSNPVYELSLLIIDVGAHSMNGFKNLSHLSHPIVKDTESACYVIQKLVGEMNNRAKNEENLRVLPRIVCVIDEFIALIGSIRDKAKANELINNISDLLMRGRHFKIHMVLAAQNPTRENVSVDISNITARIAFKCAKPQNSVTILGEGGAENLPGKGAFLYKSSDYPDLIPIQGAYISDEEIAVLMEKVNDCNKNYCNQFVIDTFDKTLAEIPLENKLVVPLNNEKNKELSEIIVQVLSCNTISAKQLKETFNMGNRANDIMDAMCRLGIISGKNANKPRNVLPITIADISGETLKFLEDNGFSAEIIHKALSKRKQVLLESTTDTLALAKCD